MVINYDSAQYLITLIETLQQKIQELEANKAPAYTYGTTDLTPGISPLATGTLYFVRE